MGLLSFCLSTLRRRPAAAVATGSPTVTLAGPRRDAARPCEPPLSFTELVAASSFLDFGGMLDERWLSGRHPDKREEKQRS